MRELAYHHFAVVELRVVDNNGFDAPGSVPVQDGEEIILQKGSEALCVHRAWENPKYQLPLEVGSKNKRLGLPSLRRDLSARPYPFGSPSVIGTDVQVKPGLVTIPDLVVLVSKHRH